MNDYNAPNDYRQYYELYHSLDDELFHFGILGMKWGVRRYQNPDGSLTDAGKRRYRVNGEGKIVKITKIQRNYLKDKTNEQVDSWHKTLSDFEKSHLEREKDKQSVKEIAEDNGFKKDEYGFLIKKTKNKHRASLMYDLTKDEMNGCIETLKSFEENESDILKECVKQIQNDKWITDWLDNVMDGKDTSKFYNNLLKQKLDIALNPQTVELWFDGGYSLGYHSITVEIDPRTKKIYGGIGIEG